MFFAPGCCANSGNSQSRSRVKEGSRTAAKAPQATLQWLQSAKQLLRFQSVYASGKSYWIITRFSSLRASSSGYGQVGCVNSRRGLLSQALLRRSPQPQWRPHTDQGSTDWAMRDVSVWNLTNPAASTPMKMTTRGSNASWYCIPGWVT